MARAEQVAPNFEGHEGRDCGEHRTVGSHRAWCHDCGEWCYPSSPCRGCAAPTQRSSIDEARAIVGSMMQRPHGDTWDDLRRLHVLLNQEVFDA